LDSNASLSSPKVVAVCPANTFPSPLDTPLFNIPAYFSHLAKAQPALPTESKIRNQRIGELLLYGEVVTSTQTLLDKNPILLRALPSPLVSLASHQLAGRGRRGNVWVAPYGCLILSIALRFPVDAMPTTSFVFIQYLAGLAVTETCREVMGPTGEQVRLKWPNDIYALESGDRVERYLSKLGGVLVNTNISDNEVDIVLGIGLNVLNSRPTTSLAQLMQGPSNALTLEKTAAILMTKFEVLWEEFLVNKGTFAPFRNLYLERWLHSDQLVTLTTETPPIQVRLVDIVPEHGFLRTIPEDPKVARSRPYVDLQPDGNSFDIMKGLIQVKQ